ncbi:hypothetical protein ACLF6K_00540 [Streptomyces xanthophaeus]|uniref:hypothetical protein n=1 Tax=Streptomyces xanthophaeus TaxID=67385 RepID=UPI0039901716
MKRATASVVALALGAAASVLGTSSTASAAAWEVDYATPASSVQCAYDITYPGGIGSVCFQKYGDVWKVGRSYYETSRTSVQWVNQLKNSSGSWVTYREGECFNDLGHSTFGTCNKDYYENSSRNALGGYGSRLAFKACLVSSCSAQSPWVYNDS